MNILYIVPYAPNQIRVRSYNLIRSLTQCGNTITVLTLISNDQDRQSVRELQETGISVHAFDMPTWHSMANALRGVFSPDPLQSYYSWSPELANYALRFVLDPANHIDVIHVEHIRGVRVAERLMQAQQKHHLPVIWDSVDSIKYLFEQAAKQSRKLTSRLITSFDLPRTRRYEGRVAAMFDATLVTSAIDRQDIIDRLPAGADPDRIIILQNGADVASFYPDPSIQREPSTLIVSGKMSYHANIAMTLHLVQNIMPLVWAEKPETRLLIVGKDPPKEIQAMAEDSRISVTGFVPDIRPYLNKATVSVAPLIYGAGSQTKVLEAMAAGTPVVTTPLAARSFSAIAGTDLLVEQDPADFAQAVLRLMNDPKKAQAVGEAGRCFVENYQSWRAIAGQLENIYERIRSDKKFRK